MSKYIDADRLMAILVKRCEEAGNQEAWFAYAKACGDARDLPAADVAEVKRGRWLQPYHNKQYKKCSVCGKVFSVNLPKNANYCPNCGSRMDLDEVEE